ncbi:unnamed protein product [Zymoseptoria tritici ST99CH_3D7]|uniref:Antifungal protein n=1 Tax=Zymoseptoria tritici (strain ST99CH_3D7) TaxID=1276538 RepID=A0A1X7S398_ZYMT9|nr:unnamed protein product [Zymoseptoria tritici ST99CH_3D7]
MQLISLALVFGLASSVLISDGQKPPHTIDTALFICQNDGDRDYPDGKCVYPDPTGQIRQVYTCDTGAKACQGQGNYRCCPYFYHVSKADCSQNCHSDVN